MTENFGYDSLKLNVSEEREKLRKWLKNVLINKIKRKGLVLGLSGGIDSTLCLAIAVESLGKERVFGMIMPDRETSSDTTRLGRMVANHYDINYEEIEISGILDELSCYKKRDEGIKELIPEYSEDWLSKIILPNILEFDRLNVPYIVAQDPCGNEVRKRVSAKAYFKIIAASNFKQRTRKILEYNHADEMNYGVIGTPNKLEYQLGFFVKNGDGAADIKPIAHLYKSQVYQLAREYKIPQEIIDRIPTTDTFSLPQTQEEFFFSLPYKLMDLCLLAFNERMEPDAISKVTSLTTIQVKRIYRDIESKIKTAGYLHLQPQILID